jgi:hypothetical protein
MRWNAAAMTARRSDRRVQQIEAAKLDGAIAANLKELRDGE